MNCLTNAAANLTRDENHIYRIGNEPRASVTQMFALTGISDASWFTDEHAQTGRAVHRGIELLEKGTLRWDSVDDTVRPYLEAYALFKDQSGFVAFPKFVEWSFYHPLYGYPGTLDVFGRVPSGELWLPDYKTGAVKWWVGLQTWLYEQGIRAAGMPLLKELQLWPLPPVKRFALRLKENGKYDLKPFHDDVVDCRLALAVVSIVQKIQQEGNGWLRKLEK